MKTLNDPVPIDDKNWDEWTPHKGLIRAAIWGAVTALAIALVLGCVAYYAPHMLLRYTLRAAVAFGVAWILFSVVHHSAGMIGTRCTALVLALTLLVLLSNHMVFAINGVLTHKGVMLIGWSYWFAPAVIGVTNLSACIGAVGCAVLCHTGAADAGTLIDILNSKVLGGRR